MAVEMPDRVLDLLSWEKKAFAFLGLVLADGTPHVTPVWFDYDGRHLIINTSRGRVKDRVLRRKPKVTLTIQDPDEPYRYVMVHGRVVEETEQDAHHQIRLLNQKYHGRYDFRALQPGEIRVTYKIEPEHVFTNR